MVAASHTPLLLRLPFANNPSLHHHLDTTLAAKSLDPVHAPRYHAALYACRLARNDFRGAALALYLRLRRLQGRGAGSNGDGHADASPAATGSQAVLDAYLALINVLACVETSQAWILADGGEGETKKKRRVVTLDEVRAEYQGELDRVAAIESGRFALVGDEGAMDVL